MASRIAQVFENCAAAGRMAFMPFLTAGDPDCATTLAAIRRLAAAKVDLIEIGFPYSDPVADGPVIQASYTRALNQKITVRKIFDSLAELKSSNVPPLVAMVSYAIVYRVGVEKFMDECVRAGLSGLIIPDLPAVEAGDVFTAAQSRGLDLVQLVAPTTPRARVREIVSRCSGFVYCIAVAGTTGERQNVADALLAQLKWLKQETKLPLAVGFGISGPEHIAALKGLADGAIVGSAIVRQFDDIASQAKTSAQVVEQVGQYAEKMVAAAAK